jgi:ribosomal protein L40E
MFVSFSGGVEHWGTICGALVPSVALIGATVADKKIRSAMVNELMAWYTQFPFPEYQPAGLNLPKVAVGSSFCHISVTTWCNVAKVSASSKIKKQRCGGLSGDVAKKTVQMLNAWKDTGTFAAAHKQNPIVATCMDCHAENEPYTQGKENCMQCHGDKLINIKKSEFHEGLF